MSLNNRAGRDLMASAARIEAIFAAGVAGATEVGLPAVGKMLRDTVRDLIDEPYPPASTPGQPPHLRTGGRWRSYDYETGDDGRAYVDVGSDEASYPEEEDASARKRAGYLEFGTSRMAPRPHLRPAVNVTRPAIPRVIAAAAEAAEREHLRRERGR